MKFILLCTLIFSYTSLKASTFEFERGGRKNFDFLMSYFDQNSSFYNCDINLKKENDLYHLYIKRLHPVIDEAVLTIELNEVGIHKSTFPISVAIFSELNVPNYQLLEHLVLKSDILGEPIEVIYTKVENGKPWRIVCAPEL
jgi:hypothetical protein